MTELVTLDRMLNGPLVEPDYDNADDWHFIHTLGIYLSGFFTTIDFVFKRVKAIDKFNLLTVSIEPKLECKDINVNGYEFVGYELLDREFGNSPLTNGGGFEESFFPKDLNDKGLIEDFIQAYNIKKRLLENNPQQHQADTNIITVWRQKTIGR